METCICWGAQESEDVRVLQGLKGETGMVLRGSKQGHFQGPQGVWERQMNDREDHLIWEWDEKVPVLRACLPNSDGGRKTCKLRWVNDEKVALILISDEGKDPKFLFKP